MSYADLKKTVHLPRTDFPMKANLGTLEPKLLAQWNHSISINAFEPTAKGPRLIFFTTVRLTPMAVIHLGTAFNKILKDFVVKLKTMEGLRFALCPRLGLPWPADRAQNR